MENKNNMQMKTENQDWQFVNSLVGILGILAPITCLAIILGQTGALTDFLLKTDYYNVKDPRFQYHHWLTKLLTWPLHLRRKKSEITHVSTPQARHVWCDGSILCTLVNTVVPGACREPKLHRMQTPKHGMKLVWEYLDIPEIFSPEEFNETYLTANQEKKFIRYLQKVIETITNYHTAASNMSFSTDYVARGMGLVIGEQYRKSTFYVYPIPKRYQQPCDLEITIKGPTGLQGYIKIPSVLHCQQRWQQPTEYRRALYFSSKLNNISPTIQGTSFLRKLSLSPNKKPVNPDLEIDIRVKMTPTRAKISYVPFKTGIYQISLVTKENHVVGSPYSIPVEIPSFVSNLSNDSDNDSDDLNGEKYVRRKKKIISRIVDFIDEKMILKNDGTLIKIDEKIENKKENNKETNFTSSNNTKQLNDKHVNVNLNKNIDVEKSVICKEPAELTKHIIKEKNDNKKYCNEKNYKNFSNEENKLIFFNNTSRLKQNDLNYNHIDKISKQKIKENDDNNINIPMNEIIKIPTIINNQQCNYIEENVFNDLTKSNISSYSTPDILDLSIKNEKSVLFIENINNDQISTTDNNECHTLPSEVPDNFSSDVLASDSHYKKTFSKSDPTKEAISKFIDYSNNDNNLVSGLRKLFEERNNVKNEENSENVFLLNGLDLIECHMKKNEILLAKEFQFDQTTNETELINKLITIGAISKNFDKYQLYLKNCLTHNFEQYINKNESKFAFNYSKQKCNIKINKQNSDPVQRSLVNKQTKFWQEKSQNHKRTADKYLPKQTTVLKHEFVRDIKNPKDGCTKKNYLHFKPFHGIVETNIQLFENKKGFGKCNTNYVNKTEKIDIRKSKSDTSLLEANNNCISQISKIVSNEVMNIPSVTEIKNKFLEACNQSALSLDKNKENSDIKLENEFIKQNKIKPKEKETEYLSKEIKLSSQHDTNLLQKQKARFQRAKKFFQNLETKQPNNDTLSKTFNPLSRSESDPCILYETKNPSTVQEKSLKISERFLVDDLFQDILGNDKRFIGIPNKMAVIASLASLDSDSSRTEFDAGNETEPDMDYFAGKPKKNKRKKISIPGFHEEFPHIPITEKWKVKSRTNLQTEEIILGRDLLTRSMDNLNRK